MEDLFGEILRLKKQVRKKSKLKEWNKTLDGVQRKMELRDALGLEPIGREELEKMTNILDELKKET